MRILESFKYYDVIHCYNVESHAKLVVFDSSALIILQKTGLLDILLGFFNCLISYEVYKECVINGKQIRQPDAYHIGKKIEDNSINVGKVNADVKEFMKKFSLGEGESASILLYKEAGANLLAIDDHKAINICRIHNVSFATSLSLSVACFRNNIIDRKECENIIQHMASVGRYKDELIQKALFEVRSENEK